VSSKAAKHLAAVLGVSFTVESNVNFGCVTYQTTNSLAKAQKLHIPRVHQQMQHAIQSTDTTIVLVLQRAREPHFLTPHPCKNFSPKNLIGLPVVFINPITLYFCFEVVSNFFLIFIAV